MKTKVSSYVKVALCLAAAGAFGIGTIPAQLVADGTTVSISGISTNIAGSLIVGNIGSFTTLIVTNAGTVTNTTTGSIGETATARTNRVIVTGPNSIWHNGTTLAVGRNGQFNELIVTNGGLVVNTFANMSASSGGSSNRAIVTGLGSRWVCTSALNVGNSGPFNDVLITNGGRVDVPSGVIGNSSFGNSVTVSGNGSVWNCTGSVMVGQNVNSNRLTIAAGGDVISAGAYVGGNVSQTGSGRNNIVVLTGAGSTWTNTGTSAVGNSGAFNQLTIANGGVMRNTTDFAALVLGWQPSGSNNVLVITGPNSQFSNRDSFAGITVGQSGPQNQLHLRDGALADCDASVIGENSSGSNNVAVLADPGSRWLNAFSLQVGGAGSGNQCWITNGALAQAGGVILGAQASSSNNLLHVQGATLIVTNVSNNGTLDIRRGTNVLVSGLVAVERLLLTNAAGGFDLRGGLFSAESSTISNGLAFRIGDGVSAATFTLAGNGLHDWAGATLRVVSSNAVLAGNGSIVGALVVTNGGILSPGTSVGKIILSNSPSLQGTVFMELSRTGISLANDQIQVLSNLTFAGTLTVTNLGPDALVLGDQYKLFDAPGFAGNFANVNLPALASGLAWTNKLLVNGSIEVVAGPVPTLYVTNLASLGPGTLRQALSDNLALGGGYTILFSSNLNGTITLGGELSVNARVNIRGPGTNVIAVSGNNLGRIFTVTAGPTLISGLTIRNGRVTGASGNQMQDGDDASGGAIWNLSTLTVSNCLVLSNSVVGGNGGPSGQGNVGRGGDANGGAVYNDGGMLTLAASVLAYNRAQGGAGGNASGGGGSTVGAGGGATGGAIANSSGTNHTIQCEFIGNSVLGGSGGVAGGSNPGGIGGSASGAGLFNFSTGRIAFSTFREGFSTGGGSTFGGLTGSAFGGAVANYSSLVVQSSTIVSNQASGVSVNDWGGGIYNGSDLALTNCTVFGNQADVGGGIYGAAVMGNTILAGNSGGVGPDANGTITSLDYNLIQSTAGATIVGVTAHNLTGVDPLLGPLQSQLGGPPVLPLLAGSPAIDQGKNFGLPVDQRGVVRPYDLASVVNAAGGDGTDIGAYEFLPVPQLNIARASSDAVVLFWSTDAAAFTLQSTTELTAPNWLPVTNQPLPVGSMVYVTNATSPFQRSYRLKWP
jgi:fibronectin-binding autotransporter adhesin